MEGGRAGGREGGRLEKYERQGYCESKPAGIQETHKGCGQLRCPPAQAPSTPVAARCRPLQAVTGQQGGLRHTQTSHTRMSTKGSRRSSAKGEEGEKNAKRRRKEGEKKTKTRRKEGENKAQRHRKWESLCKYAARCRASEAPCVLQPHFAAISHTKMWQAKCVDKIRCR
jgi:hypothetical protein